MTEKSSSSVTRHNPKGRNSSATAKLKARCVFLGIEFKGMNNNERKAAVRKATNGLTWPVFLATRDADVNQDGSIEYRRTERKLKKEERNSTRDERRVAQQKRTADRKKARDLAKRNLNDKTRRQLEKKVARQQKLLDNFIAEHAKHEQDKALYNDNKAA